MKTIPSARNEQVKRLWASTVTVTIVMLVMANGNDLSISDQTGMDDMGLEGQAIKLQLYRPSFILIPPLLL